MEMCLENYSFKKLSVMEKSGAGRNQVKGKVLLF